jgi:hypothetical protein
MGGWTSNPRASVHGLQFADIERHRLKQNRHLTGSLTALVGQPTPRACGSITTARADCAICVTPWDHGRAAAIAPGA